MDKIVCIILLILQLSKNTHLPPVGAALGFLGLAGAVLLVLEPSMVVLAALGPQHLLLAPKF
jgi:hypothetical protein